MFVNKYNRLRTAAFKAESASDAAASKDERAQGRSPRSLAHNADSYGSPPKHLVRTLVRIDLATGYFGENQCNSLKVGRLVAVGFGYMRIADQHHTSTFRAAVLASPVLGVPVGSINKIWASSCATGRC